MEVEGVLKVVAKWAARARAECAMLGGGVSGRELEDAMGMTSKFLFDL